MRGNAPEIGVAEGGKTILPNPQTQAGKIILPFCNPAMSFPMKIKAVCSRLYSKMLVLPVGLVRML